MKKKPRRLTWPIVNLGDLPWRTSKKYLAGLLFLFLCLREVTSFFFYYDGYRYDIHIDVRILVRVLSPLGGVLILPQANIEVVDRLSSYSYIEEVRSTITDITIIIQLLRTLAASPSRYIKRMKIFREGLPRSISFLRIHSWNHRERIIGLSVLATFSINSLVPDTNTGRGEHHRRAISSRRDTRQNCIG